MEKHLQRTVITTLILFSCFAAWAQQLAVERFTIDENDQTARITNPRKDQNDRVCAIVKMETPLLLQDFTYNAGMTGIVHTEQHTGEIWVYLSPGAQRLTIQHKHLGTVRNYPFGEALREATVYILKLKSGNVKTVVEDNVALQYFEVNCAIDGATISIDDADPEPFIEGKFSKLLSYGKHQYTIEAPLYYPLRGITDITIKKQPPLAAALQPAFGKIVVNTQPEQGADVFIDGEKRGQSPLILDKVRSGEHTVRVMKTLYLPADGSTVVSEGQTATVTITMKPNFAALTFNAEGDIYVNDDYKATGTWQGRLAPGIYKVEVRKQGHRPSLTTIEAKTGDTRTVALEAPVPVYGSLNISANVTAQIYVDDKPTGETTPYLMNQVLAGSHTIELRANGYQPHQQTVEIQEGKITTLQSVLQKAAPIPTSALVRTTSDCGNAIINLGEVGFVSNKIWTFGRQTWSAPVTAAYCEKTAFDGGTEGNYRADCRKNPKTKYGNLFSWCMVATYAEQLCPSPWRVPTESDFNTLVSNTTYSTLISAWDYGGDAQGSSMSGVDSQANYWSSTQSDMDNAYYLYYYSDNLSVNNNAGRYYGMQVRCVKDDSVTKPVDVPLPTTPLHAASANTWTFDSSSLTWSDAIHIPDCNKTSFTDSYTDPHCRSYTENGSTWYYYNWPYVNQNAATLCSSPWRVPTRLDFDRIVSDDTGHSTLSSAWGYGGYAYRSSMRGTSNAYYWSSTENGSSTAYNLRYSSSKPHVSKIYGKSNGMQVRCVK
jgi:uncharacterized protein (TIGR02145 family)